MFNSYRIVAGKNSLEMFEDEKKDDGSVVESLTYELQTTPQCDAEISVSELGKNPRASTDAGSVIQMLRDLRSRALYVETDEVETAAAEISISPVESIRKLRGMMRDDADLQKTACKYFSTFDDLSPTDSNKNERREAQKKEKVTEVDEHSIANSSLRSTTSSLSKKKKSKQRNLLQLFRRSKTRHEEKILPAHNKCAVDESIMAIAENEMYGHNEPEPTFQGSMTGVDMPASNEEDHIEEVYEPPHHILNDEIIDEDTMAVTTLEQPVMRICPIEEPHLKPESESTIDHKLCEESSIAFVAADAHILNEEKKNKKKKTVTFGLLPYIPEDIAQQGKYLVDSMLSGLSDAIYSSNSLASRAAISDTSKMAQTQQHTHTKGETESVIQANTDSEGCRTNHKANLSLAIAGDDESIISFASSYRRMDKTSLLQKLKESKRRQRNLEMQLKNNGVLVPEDIDYKTAKAEIQRIAKRMQEIGGSNVTHPEKRQQDKLREEYFRLEQEMERYTSALVLTKEYRAEQAAIEKRWEEQNDPLNKEALRKILRHMPVRIRFMTELELTTTPSPNGKTLPSAIVKRFKRSNILQILRTHPDVIEKMHPAQLESYRMTGLTLTERRALHAHLRILQPRWEKSKSDKLTDRKLEWLNNMKNAFKDELEVFQRHVHEYGSADCHPSRTKENQVGCPLLGRKCPVRADAEADYSEDYGWPQGDVYETTTVDASARESTNALKREQEMERERRAKERLLALKDHYKGNLVQVSKANGVCETMDQVMDKMEATMAHWLQGTLSMEYSSNNEVVYFTEVLMDLKPDLVEICATSGMELRGTRGKKHDYSSDLRSVLECGLAEDLHEASQEFFAFLTEQMNELNIRDARITTTISLLQELLSELHDRNTHRLKTMGSDRPLRSRVMKKNSALRDIRSNRLSGDDNDLKVGDPRNHRLDSNKPASDVSHNILAALKARKKTEKQGRP